MHSHKAEHCFPQHELLKLNVKHYLYIFKTLLVKVKIKTPKKKENTKKILKLKLAFAVYYQHYLF